MGTLELLRRNEELEEAHGHLNKLSRNSFAIVKPTQRRPRFVKKKEVGVQYIAVNRCVTPYSQSQGCFIYSRAESQEKNVIELVDLMMQPLLPRSCPYLTWESGGWEFVLINKKAELITVISSTMPFRYKNGKVIGFVSISIFPKPNSEMSPESKVGMPIHTASDRPLHQIWSVPVLTDFSKLINFYCYSINIFLFHTVQL